MGGFKMKILGVKFYQGVKLSGETHTYVQPAISEQTGNLAAAKGYKIETQQNGVMLTKGNRSTLTSWNNIQYIEYDNTEPVPIVESSKKIK
jgi:hypothetical protein